MGILVIQNIEADGARFGSLGSETMADGLPRVRRNEAPQLIFGDFMFVMCSALSVEDGGKFRPSVRRLMSTMRTASTRVLGNSAPIEWVAHPLQHNVRISARR